MGVWRLTARLSYCVPSLGAAGPLPKRSAEFLGCRELYLRFSMRHKKCHVHYKYILNSRCTSFFFGTDVQSGDLLPRCKLPNIDSFKGRTKEWVLN